MDLNEDRTPPLTQKQEAPAARPGAEPPLVPPQAEGDEEVALPCAATKDLCDLSELEEGIDAAQVIFDDLESDMPFQLVKVTFDEMIRLLLELRQLREFRVELQGKNNELVMEKRRLLRDLESSEKRHQEQLKAYGDIKTVVDALLNTPVNERLVTLLKNEERLRNAIRTVEGEEAPAAHPHEEAPAACPGEEPPLIPPQAEGDEG